MRRHGWWVLHSIPLPRNVDLDHLLIGPGGVFSVIADPSRQAGMGRR
ncbi:nuclease-related domain-containing protein [Streptomyces sp. NPDC012510]